MDMFLITSTMDITGTHIIGELQCISIEDIGQCLCMHTDIQDSIIQDITTTIIMTITMVEEIIWTEMTIEDQVHHIGMTIHLDLQG